MKFSAKLRRGHRLTIPGPCVIVVDRVHFDPVLGHRAIVTIEAQNAHLDDVDGVSECRDCHQRVGSGECPGGCPNLPF